ncbi:MAG TPA: hypothetical protein VFE50_08650, partial [Cyclobacteriaceae bacterium]|nr:hypothetical protein [Cyclobacteriaceae bacterium]
MKIRVALALIAATLLPYLTFSQTGSRDKVTQGIEWFALTNNIKVSKHHTIIAEGQFRFANEL